MISGACDFQAEKAVTVVSRKAHAVTRMRRNVDNDIDYSIVPTVPVTV